MKDADKGRLISLVFYFVECRGPVLHKEEGCSAIRDAAKKFSSVTKKFTFYRNSEGGFSTIGVFCEAEVGLRTSADCSVWGSLTVSSKPGAERTAYKFVDALYKSMQPTQCCYEEVRINAKAV